MIFPRTASDHWLKKKKKVNQKQLRRQGQEEKQNKTKKSNDINTFDLFVKGSTKRGWWLEEDPRSRGGFVVAVIWG